MNHLLRRGLERMRVALPEAAGETVKVRAGAHVIEAVEMVPGGRTIRSYNLDEYTGTEEAFDWLVPEQALVFPDCGKKLEPERGWEIWWTMEDGRTAVFVALAQGDGRVFDVMDQLGLMYRIHTKLDRIESS